MKEQKERINKWTKERKRNPRNRTNERTKRTNEDERKRERQREKERERERERERVCVCVLDTWALGVVEAGTDVCSERCISAVGSSDVALEVAGAAAGVSHSRNHCAGSLTKITVLLSDTCHLLSLPKSRNIPGQKQLKLYWQHLWMEE